MFKHGCFFSNQHISKMWRYVYYVVLRKVFRILFCVRLWVLKPSDIGFDISLKDTFEKPLSIEDEVFLIYLEMETLL